MNSHPQKNRACFAAAPIPAVFTSPNPNQNHLLAALPREEFETLSAQLELVVMPLGKMLYGPDEQLHHAYFPTTSIISLHCILESGASAETASVGAEGLVGTFLFMGGETTSSSAVVQISGHAYRLDRRLLKNAFNAGGLFQKLLLRYTQSLLTRMAQTAVCNRHHSVEQQLCRSLLQNLDRIPNGELVMTQELLASLLGVRRESLTVAAGNLQRDGLISYHRGHITVLDREGLEASSCECYRVVKKECMRLQSDVLYRQPLTSVRR